MKENFLFVSIRMFLFRHIPCIPILYFAMTSVIWAQVIEVQPVFPRVTDDVTITFVATEGNGALTGVSPVYAHTGLITSASQNGSDWKHVQGVWGTPDPNVLMQSLGNNRHSISYNIQDYYGVPLQEEVLSLAFVFRNANGSIVGRASDGADIYYPVYPANVDFLSVLLSPQQTSLALFESEVLPIRGATSQDADLYLIDNNDTLATQFGTLLDYSLTVTDAGNHDVRFVAVRGTDTLTQSFFYTVIVSVVTEDPPPGMDDGMTMLDDSTAYFQLYAPGKAFIHLTGDLNDWRLESAFQMKRSVNGNTWWLEVPGLEPGARYAYQYVVDGILRIGDPYSTLVLDPFNDNAIPAVTYPDMPVYPYARTTGIVTSFEMKPVQVTPPLSPKPEKPDLIIYELLLRDFLHAHSFDALRDTLDYLQRLGVNAIELMPVNEFEGNIGWGYNPSYHMALDKYYGSSDSFRALVEECHERGMAVILDVVYNHAFGQSPFAQLYWDGALNRPAANNPWLNPMARHDFNVGYDFNHESPATKYFVKRVLSWWMETYGIDGFRFDLSKGFTQKNTLGNVAAWGAFDPSRVEILQEYADHIWSIDPDAYVILEHFADNTEEKELSARGMMLWGNMNGPFSQASMGYGGSDISGTWHIHRGWDEPHLVGYMESHDEERIMYKNLSNGNSAPGYNIRELNVALARIELVSAFFYLIPGPKMLWEFGELGYDFSINRCSDGTINNNCRLDPKPIRWDYLDVFRRKRIYDIDRALILLRQQTAFKEGELEISLANQFEKKMRFRHSEMDIVVVGNFNIGNRNIAPVFTKPGWWYDYLGGDSLWVDDVNIVMPFMPGQYHVYTSKRLNLEFDITTSISELQVGAQSLWIYPLINSGEFHITLPDQISHNAGVMIFDMAGRAIPANVIREDDALKVDIEKPASGMYIVHLLHGNKMYTGKIIIP